MENQFISLFKDALEIEDYEVKMGDAFKDLDEWDSIGLLSVIAMVDEEFDVVLESKDLDKVNTLSELYEFIQAKKN